MGAHTRSFKTAVSSSLILSLLVLAGCNKPGDTLAQNYAATATPPQPAPYTPPTADQLSQMVAPIALFPDKLVGQVLAGATYPDQIAAANQWLGQNPSLKGDALQTAETSQPWDVSVKSLTTFPNVLGQMANNIQWTTALGEAYVNDPNDVMNAIQVLRSRAQQSGNLKTSPHLRVSTVVRPSEPAYVTRSPSEPVVYSGPAVIQPPPQTIVIEPAEPDVVYVPQYNPTVVYGAPMPVYPGWVYHQPAYTTETLVTTGALSFGIGVLVGAAVSHHHDWGWNSWGVNWGGPAPSPGYGGGWHRPAVVYNNSTYISKSVTVVNHVNNINVTNNTYRTTNNINNVVNRTQNFAINNAPARPVGMMNAPHFVPNAAPHPVANVAALAATPSPQRQGGMMSMPHFTPRDATPGSRPPPPAPAQPMHAAAAPHMNQFAAAPHNAPMVQHDTHEQPQVPHALQAARTPPEAVKPVHEERGIERMPAQAVMDRPHADAMRERVAEERSSQLRPAQHVEAGMPHAPLPNREATNPNRGQAPAIHQDVLAMHNAHAHPAIQPQAKHVEKHGETAHKHDKHEAQERHG